MDKQDRFDRSGEAMGYISLDQAILLARQQAREDAERYCQRLGWEEIVWSELSSEHREDTYRVVLQFRRPAREVREEQTGEEEFVFDLTGKLVFRQVLAWPESAESAPPPPMAPPVEEAVSPPPTPPPTEEVPQVHGGIPGVPILVGGRAVVCTQCEAANPEGNRFCVWCGSQLQLSAVPPVEEGLPTAAQASPPLAAVPSSAPHAPMPNAPPARVWTPAAPPTASATRAGVPLPGKDTEYMGFWIRFPAAWIDSVLTVLVAAILDAIAVFQGLGALLSVLYYVLFTGLKGQTLGKMALRIKVVNAQGNVPGIGAPPFGKSWASLSRPFSSCLATCGSAGTAKSAAGTTT